MITYTITITVTIQSDTPSAPAASAPQTAAPRPVASPAAKRVPVGSSVIAFASYNVVTRTLTIEFQSGKIYAYDGVPSYIFDELLETASAGRYFNYYIKDKYSTRDITR